MKDGKQSIGVVFGSRSVEHDVSLVTAQQVMQALDPARYDVVPIYLDRKGRWWTGEGLRKLKNFEDDRIHERSDVEETHLSPSTSYPGLITPPVAGRLNRNKFQPIDVFFPVVHGSHGEDGTLQGLFEMVNVPYVGAGVLASAIANDKGMTKLVLKEMGIPVLEKYTVLSRGEWLANRDQLLESISTEIGYPAFVKPLTLGSSIGIAKVEDPDDAALHIDIVTNLDQCVLVEQAAVKGHIIEVNCAVLGNEDLRPSVLEQPISYDEFLTYDEKYLRSGGKGMKGQERQIPAPISPELTARIQEAAVNAFKGIRGRGTARIDFLACPATGDFWLNEINTMPGSLAFYLWEPMGMSASAVCDELIHLAWESHAEKRNTTYDYKTDLIKVAAGRGSKGAKASLAGQ